MEAFAPSQKRGRQAVKDVQLLTNLLLGYDALRVDGIPGPKTVARITSLTGDALSILEGLASARQIDLGGLGRDADAFKAEVLPAVLKIAKATGLLPDAVAAQLALETGWGKKVLRTASGGNSYNYGNIKTNALKGWPGRLAGEVEVKALEYVNGKPVYEVSSFAVFASIADFADAYVWYLLYGPSAYRYPGLRSASTAREYGRILKKGNYATDPNYPSLLADVAKTVATRYGHLLA